MALGSACQNGEKCLRKMGIKIIGLDKAKLLSSMKQWCKKILKQKKINLQIKATKPFPK